MQFMSTGMRAGLTLGLVAATACLTPRQTVQTPRTPDVAARPATVTSAYAGWRYIGVAPLGATSCPEAGAAWKGRPLLPTAPIARHRGDDAATVAVLENLASFCVYELSSGAQTAAARGGVLPPPPKAGTGLLRIDPDAAALTMAGAADDLAAMTAAPLHEQFERLAGQVVSLPAPRPSRTRLSFLDTQPTDTGVPTQRGNSLHGYTLAHIGGELLCGGGGPGGTPCDEIATQLAMPIVRFDGGNPGATRTDLEKGGNAGTFTDLASAITSAVEDWHECRLHETERTCAGAGRHLVLNLSLGWDGETFGGLETKFADMPAPVQLIYWALRLAAQRDVLVVAAAGNVFGGLPNSAGPVLPAAWEGRPPIPPCGPALSAPLLYAVGALQANGHRLGNMRPAAMPPRAAFGDHAVVFDGGRPLPALTGTSVSAAVVSAAAALVWDYQPKLHSSDVMNMVTANGSPLDYAADFAWGPGPALPVAQRITVCAALAAACTAGSCGASWSPPGDCTSPQSLVVTASLYEAQAQFRAEMGLNGTHYNTHPLLSLPGCSSSGTMYYSTIPHYFCPDEALPSLDGGPYIDPQPEQDPCPTCTMGPGGGNGQESLLAVPRLIAPMPAVLRAGQTSIGRAVKTSADNRADGADGGVSTDAAMRSDGSPAPLSWTLRVKIRDKWSQCPSAATLDLDVIDPAGPSATPPLPARQRISYAIDAPLCDLHSLELSGIAVPAGATVESAWLTFVVNGMAVRSQLYIPPQ